jgi:hypothetical protein
MYLTEWLKNGGGAYRIYKITAIPLSSNQDHGRSHGRSYECHSHQNRIASGFHKTMQVLTTIQTELKRPQPRSRRWWRGLEISWQEMQSFCRETSAL